MIAAFTPEGIADHARRWTGAALDLLLPPHCLTCDQEVDVAGHLCPDCFGQIQFASGPCCRQCGVPFPPSDRYAKAELCPTCWAEPPDFDRAHAALRYDLQARRLILPLKYGDRIELAPLLGAFMARAGAALLAEAEVIVPVPLHRSRLFSRRYNQAALLARVVARLARRPVAVDALRRTRRTRPLARRGAAERETEVADAFTVSARKASRIGGRRVMLVDDVLTSGATAGACARALKAAGASGVDVLVAARVADPRFE